eukprot:SAG31_NODE_1352_length_8668_cov_38.573229_10_plen_61_part_00
MLSTAAIMAAIDADVYGAPGIRAVRKSRPRRWSPRFNAGMPMQAHGQPLMRRDDSDAHAL